MKLNSFKDFEKFISLYPRLENLSKELNRNVPDLLESLIRIGSDVLVETSRIAKKELKFTLDTLENKLNESNKNLDSAFDNLESFLKENNKIKK